MVARILTAVVGGSLITTVMLLGMNQFTERFKEQDPMRYFGIADFIPAPEGRRPTPPPAPATPPDRPQIDLRRPGDTRVPVASPEIEPDRVAPPPLIPDPVGSNEPSTR